MSLCPVKRFCILHFCILELRLLYPFRGQAFVCQKEEKEEEGEDDDQVSKSIVSN